MDTMRIFRSFHLKLVNSKTRYTYTYQFSSLFKRYIDSTKANAMLYYTQGDTPCYNNTLHFLLE